MFLRDGAYTERRVLDDRGGCKVYFGWVRPWRDTGPAMEVPVTAACASADRASCSPAQGASERPSPPLPLQHYT